MVISPIKANYRWFTIAWKTFNCYMFSIERGLLAPLPGNYHLQHYRQLLMEKVIETPGSIVC